MRAALIRRFMLLISVFLMAQTAPTSAREQKSTAFKVYEEEVGLTATDAIQSELRKHPERVEEITLELTFQVDLKGRVHNANIIPSRPNQWAQNTARRILADLKLPPVPQKLADELRGAPVNVETTLKMGIVHTGNTSVKPDSPETIAYLKKVDTIISSALNAEVLKRRGPVRADVTIALLLDREGHVRAQEIRSEGADDWTKDMATRIVRAAKLPPVPKKVVAEHPEGLVAFGTHWIYNRSD